MENFDSYEDLYRADARSAWLNGAYDEMGDQAVCDICGEEMVWDPARRVWLCDTCGREMNRAAWFNHIGAEPPGSRCLSQCQENYPLCKQWCTWYEIDEEDPIL